MKLAPIDSGQIEAGSQFTLGVTLMFGQAEALYFQDDQLVSSGQLQVNMPYCRMTTGDPATPRVVEPATFTVRSVGYDDRSSASGVPTPKLTRIELSANPRQPYTLACQWPQGAPTTDFLTTQEILGTIGAHFKLALQH